MTEWQDTVSVEAPELLPYLAAAADGRLLLPRCRACRRVQFPPRPTCRYCCWELFDWSDTPLVGSLYSWTVTRRAPLPSLQDVVPYAVVVVALDLPDLVRVVGRLEGYQEGQDLIPGERVVGQFVNAADSGEEGYPVLSWRLAR